METLTKVLLVILTAAASTLLASYPTMLVIGALHSSEGLSAIPALGYLQTLGVLYLISVVGVTFRG